MNRIQEKHYYRNGRAWYKLLYSDGDERQNMWTFIMSVVRFTFDHLKEKMGKLCNQNENIQAAKI